MKKIILALLATLCFIGCDMDIQSDSGRPIYRLEYTVLNNSDREFVKIFESPEELGFEYERDGKMVSTKEMHLPIGRTKFYQLSFHQDAVDGYVYIKDPENYRFYEDSWNDGIRLLVIESPLE